MTGLLAGAAAAAIAPCAWAQTVGPQAASPQTSDSQARALFAAPFAAAAPPQDATSAPPPALLGSAADVGTDANGAFAMPVYAGASLDQSRLLAPDRLSADGGLVVWNSNEVAYAKPGGAVDSVRLAVGGVALAPGGVITAGPNGLLDPDARAFDVSYTRSWPSAFKMNAGRFDVDLSPHAGVGVSSGGGSAEAGAMLRFGEHLGDEVAQRFGFHKVSSASFDGRGRWFLFAAASGQAVGLNMTSGPAGLQRSGWSAEPASALISDAQAGVGWRKGNLQASFGYVHRDIHGADPTYLGVTQEKFSDSMVAFSLSIHPH